ncbi:MAG: CvpA family protein [Planctomycetes bacterium]|nr:CvpA family protein [Planctomycetota bacterium]
MLLVFTVVIMLGCGVAQYRNGLFTSVAMLISIVFSGLVAFNFWEPIADWLDPLLQGSTLAGCEDMVCLSVLFSIVLAALRVITNSFAPDMLEEHGWLQHFGAFAVGAVTGYLASGFLICAMQTLPLDERFLDFQPRIAGEPIYRALVPGDRVWLAMMRHAGAGPLSGKEDPDAAGLPAVERFRTFDAHATFELRYWRYRRHSETRGPMPYFGEFEKEVGKQQPR